MAAAAGREEIRIQRQTGRLQQNSARIIWYGEELKNKLNVSARRRITLAANLLRDRVVINLGRPVRKIKGKRGGTIVDPNSRSKPGEFPRADTTRLMKDIFARVETTARGYSGQVGTTLNYGLIHETQTGRSFLVRTLNEVQAGLLRIMRPGNGSNIT